MPVPPPFMWSCRPCAELLVDLAQAYLLDHELYDGAVRCQLLISNHLATAHPSEIPEPHDGCPRCDHFAKWAEQQGMHDLWLEHRARDLFLPAAVARLM
jgi:hypothetical protein